MARVEIIIAKGTATPNAIAAILVSFFGAAERVAVKPLPLDDASALDGAVVELGTFLHSQQVSLMLDL